MSFQPFFGSGVQLPIGIATGLVGIALPSVTQNCTDMVVHNSCVSQAFFRVTQSSLGNNLCTVGDYPIGPHQQVVINVPAGSNYLTGVTQGATNGRLTAIMGWEK